MKAKYALIALLVTTFFGCDDNTAGLGLGMFPESDQNINGQLTTFDVVTSSIPTGKIYAKTNVGYVGKFTDATFGAYNASFLATLNCPADLTFPKAYKESSDGTAGTGTMVTDFTNVGLDQETINKFQLITDGTNGIGGNPIGNCQINIYLWYSSYFGDSLTACRMSVYELDQSLKKDDAYYTNIEPDDYYNPADLLGTKAYTAVDLSVSDSIRNLSTYNPKVTLALNQAITKKLGSKILKSAAEKKESFSQYFNELFKGIYVKSDFGDGTVLYINQVQMDIVSLCYAVNSKGKKLKSNKYAGKDSIAYSGRAFASTREVIQANQLLTDKDKIKELIEQSNNTYIKSPAGIFTQAELPISQIGEQLKLDTLNAVKLTFSNYNQSSDKKFGMSIPSTVMLIRKKNKDIFFEKNKLPDNATSFLASHTSSVNQYTFSNITKLVNDCLADGEREKALKTLKDNGKIKLTITNSDGTTSEKDVVNITEWEKYSDWNKVILIPVLVTYDSASSGYTSNVISVQHDLKPGYVRLKGGSDQNGNVTSDQYKLKLEVIHTNFAPTGSK